MSTLIIFLPTTPPGATPGYAYALTTDGRTLSDHASAPLTLLPAAPRGGEVVALVPVSQLSWHSVELPKGVGAGSPRLRPILDGLLEDRLLDESAQLHLALAPGAAAGGRAWVAACDKAWLRGHLQVLESVQRPVARIVPEFAPETGALQLHAVGEADAPQLVVTGEGVGGVLRMPLAAAALTLLPPLSTDEELLVQAEPGVAALAEELLQRKVSLQTRPQRWLDAVRTPWDLAQFDLASSGRTRTVKRLSGVARELLQAPGWRAARWGVLLLLLANLAGLNAWAWKVQSALQTRRAAVQGALTQTFPQVRLVVDAPLQMEREVALLRQATGAASGRDLEAMLAALGSALPAGMAAASLEFTGGEVRVKGLQLAAQDAAGVAGQLKSLGYSARLDGETLLLKQDLPQAEGAP